MGDKVSKSNDEDCIEEYGNVAEKVGDIPSIPKFKSSKSNFNKESKLLNLNIIQQEGNDSNINTTADNLNLFVPQEYSGGKGCNKHHTFKLSIVVFLLKNCINF